MPLKPRPQITQPTDPSYRLIPLTHGKVTLVDAEDFDVLTQRNWSALHDRRRRTFRAVRSDRRNGKNFLVVMAREIMKAPSGVLVDHKDGDPLNNRKSNLRFATHSQNSCNREKGSNNKSGYKGVHFQPKGGKYEASIQIKRKRIYLGFFADPKDAYAAYVEAAHRYQGEFACPSRAEKEGKNR